MISTPFKLVSVTSLIILSVSACSNHSINLLPETSSVAYDHTQRNTINKQKYISQFQQAYIRTYNNTKTTTTSRNNDRVRGKGRLRSTKHRPIRLVKYVSIAKRPIQKRAYHPQKKIFQKVGHYSYQRNKQLQRTWSQLHSGFKIGSYNHKYKVRKYVKKYASMPGQMAELSRRSSKYMPTILAEIKKRHMPTEIALLPFVESAFNDRAYSHAKAAGLWQFIPATARRYGLHISSRYDARYNWKASTRAALNYLQDLNREFKGDWLLSLAAYNCGEARVQREIARNRARGLPTDFWNLRLPKETKNYVPRLLAFKEIYSKPRVYGLKVPHIPAQKEALKRVPYKASSPTKWRKHRIVTHQVKMGDTLYQIAKRYNTSVYSIMRMNGLTSTNIKLGKRLKIALTHSRQLG